MGKVPKLRFEGFEGDWERKKFGDIGSVSMCKRVFKNETTNEGDVPFFKIGTFGGQPDAFISRELYEEYKNKYSFPKVGDILLSASGTIGRLVEYRGEDAYYQDSNIIWLSHDESTSNRFLKSLYEIVEWNGIEGSTIKRLYNDNFLKTSFYIPLLQEQEKIGGMLSNLDHLLTLQQRKLGVLLQAKKFYLQNLFPRKGEKTPRLRFAGFSGEWEKKKMNEFVLYSSSSLSAKDASDNGLYDLYDANHVIGKTDNTPFYTDYISIIKDGAGIGRIRKLPKNTMIIGTMGAIQAHYSDLNFVFALMSGEDFVKNASGSTIPHIYFKDYGNNKYLIPTIVEQEILGQFFNTFDHIITLQTRKLETLKRLKQFMLQNLFV